jgi:DnaJ domain
MARRRGMAATDDPIAILKGSIILGSFYLVAQILPILALYGPPIGLAVALLYWEIRARHMTRNPALNEEETEKLSELENELKSIGWRLTKIDDEAERLNLKRNLDGSIYRGSKLGRESGELSERFEELQNGAYALRKKPLAELKEWTRTARFRFALRVSTAVYVVSSVYSLREHNFEMVDLPEPPTIFLIAGLFAVSYAIHWGWAKLKTHATRNALEEFADYEYAGDFFDLVEDEGDEKSGADEDADSEVDGEQPEHTEHSVIKPQPWYETLGVTPSATREEIEAAWHAKMKKNHPDRVATLDPEFQALAEERTKRLNAAHEEALRRLGVSY